MYRQLAALTENFPGDAASLGNNFLPQYQALYAQNSDLAGWIQIDGTNINYPVMQSKQDLDFYLKHNFEKADSPHGCPYVQVNCDLQTPSDNILVYGHNMKDGTMFSDLLQYKRESFWEQHRIIRFDTLTAQAKYTVMAVFRAKRRICLPIINVPMPKHRRNLPPMWTPVRTSPCMKPACRLLMGTSCLRCPPATIPAKISRVVVVAKRITEPR